MSASDHLTWVDIAGTVVTLGAPILLEVLAKRGRERFGCKVVEIHVDELIVEDTDGKRRRYRLADEVVGAEPAAGESVPA